MPTAIVTGASQGLGLAVTQALSEGGWTVIVDARNGDLLRRATAGLAGVRAISGDVTDAEHRKALVAAAGTIDLLVLNASSLGPTPLPRLAAVDIPALTDVFATNAIAPLALTQIALPGLRASRSPAIVAISSDAAVEAYPGWGAYGAAKAALDHLFRVLAAEEPGIGVYVLDPGDMRTAMAQHAFPGEDISDRADPAAVVPALLRLLTDRPESVRHTAQDLLAGATR